MATVIVDVLGALSPVAVLVGVWLGKRWEGRTTTDAWLRDRRLAAYTRFIARIGELHDGVDAVWRDPAAWQGRSASVDASYRAMSDARHEIALLGPQDVSDAAGSVLAALTDLVDVVEAGMAAGGGADSGAAEAGGVRQAGDAALAAKHAFIAAAQEVVVAPPGRPGRRRR